MAPPLQLAWASWQYRVKASRQQTRPSREQPVEAPHDSNVEGMLFKVQKALPFLNDGASIILTGSAAATKGTPSFGIYAASSGAHSCEPGSRN
jgi:NADP-dependent 3-hydroxy acid dehydrogenase YdfG